MKWPWARWVRQAKDGRPAERAREQAEEKLQQARQRRPEVRKAAADLAWTIEQSMRRPR